MPLHSEIMLLLTLLCRGQTALSRAVFLFSKPLGVRPVYIHLKPKGIWFMRTVFTRISDTSEYLQSPNERRTLKQKILNKPRLRTSAAPGMCKTNKTERYKNGELLLFFFENDKFQISAASTSRKI